MPQLPVTSLYAIPLAIIFLVLFMQIVFLRTHLSQSIGDGGSKELHERIRRHGNFVEWVPMVLILLTLNEAQGTGPIWLHMSGALLTIGRILHPFGLKADNSQHPLRIAGNMGGILATVILTISLIISHF